MRVTVPHCSPTVVDSAVSIVRRGPAQGALRSNIVYIELTK